MEPLVAEIISVGNELLSGRVVNTNASWIADKITRLGGVVRRIVAVGDNVEECSTVIKEVLGRRPKLIIMTGGLGPTFDDRTLESLSIALNVPLEVNLEALRMIEEKYGGEVNPPRFKMARLPRGSNPLYNFVGTAPGCLVKANDTIIVALPGVPSEMKAMFEAHVEPLISRLTSTAYVHRLIRVRGIEESSLAPMIDDVMKRYKAVYVKSHPKRNGELHIDVELSCRAQSIDDAKKNVDEACSLLIDLILKAGATAEELI
ncbi:MAG: molybdopterin-binding protein [Candidatus Nezhaarchaeota archaeon]|nr:molybdopterin-binding protein [Candidatus Nezhaarchaeota archaeon]MCX8141813.1 molybdopterin-binding protein [Candidatus Nezhaarchaeota archaeon]MDW8050406.1 molybdopterin-binding protein [Nitrososphaerota archaeon]